MRVPEEVGEGEGQRLRSEQADSRKSQVVPSTGSVPAGRYPTLLLGSWASFEHNTRVSAARVWSNDAVDWALGLSRNYFPLAYYPDRYDASRGENVETHLATRATAAGAPASVS